MHQVTEFVVLAWLRVAELGEIRSMWLKQKLSVWLKGG